MQNLFAIIERRYIDGGDDSAVYRVAAEAVGDGRQVVGCRCV